MRNNRKSCVMNIFTMSIALSTMGLTGCAVSAGGLGSEPEARTDAPAASVAVAGTSASTRKVGQAADVIAAPKIVRTATWRGMQVTYEVTDGLAVMGGDMVLGPVDEAGNLRPPDGAGATQSLLGLANDYSGGAWRWPKRDYGSLGLGGCQVHYQIHYTIHEHPEELDAIYRAIEYFNTNTQCRWDPDDGTNANHVLFTHSNFELAGRSPLGRQCHWSGDWVLCSNQTLELNCSNALDCEGTVKHEMMHALGFAHEHQRPNSGTYVDFKESAFGDPAYAPIHDPIYVDRGGASYDLYSITHYRTDCQFIPAGIFFGAWECWGSKLIPKGIEEHVLVLTPADLDISIGGSDLSGADLWALRAAYPWPNFPPSSPPRCSPSLCQRAPDAPCC